MEDCNLAWGSKSVKLQTKARLLTMLRSGGQLRSTLSGDPDDQGVGSEADVGKTEWLTSTFVPLPLVSVSLVPAACVSVAIPRPCISLPAANT